MLLLEGKFVAVTNTLFMKQSLHPHQLVSLFILLLLANSTQSQWHERLHTWVTTRQGGNIPLFIQYVDQTNQLGVYGDFDSVVADGVHSFSDVGNTMTLTNEGWKSAGHAYNYLSAYSVVSFHNKLFGSDYIVHSEQPYFKKLNTATGTYEGYSGLEDWSSNFIFFQWKKNVLLTNFYNMSVWDMKANKYYRVGGGSLGYDIGTIKSLDISQTDSTLAFITTNTAGGTNGLRVLRYGDSTWSTDGYPPLPDNARRIEVASKKEMYVLVNSTDPTNKFAALYALNLAAKTWEKIITFKMKDRLSYPDVKAIEYGNGALHFMGTFDSCNGQWYASFTVFHYALSNQELTTNSPNGLNLSCLDDYGDYYRLFAVGKKLYLAGTGGLCGLELEAFLYEMTLKDVLPITIYNFTAQSIGSANRLQWQAFGKTIQSFTIERSTDGSNFSPIGSLSSKASDGGEQSYTFTDTKPEGPISYYRLKGIETDNQVTYSSIRKVVNGTNNFSATLQTNMVRSDLSINFTSPVQTQVNISVYSTTGTALTQYVTSISAGVSSKGIDINKLADGMYFIRIQTNNTKTITFKFLKL